MPITYRGPFCARRGCRRPEWEAGLCNACARLARLFGKDPALFAYEPLHGYGDERDAVALPWARWEAEAATQGRTVADLLADAPPPPPPPPD
jgi:hypothetical protein